MSDPAKLIGMPLKTDQPADKTAMRTRWINISGGVCRGTLSALLSLIFIFGVALIGATQKAFASAQSQSDPYLLDAAEIAGKKDFQIAVPTNGFIHLTFIKATPTNEPSVFLYLSPFYGDKSGRELWHCRSCVSVMSTDEHKPEAPVT